MVNTLRAVYLVILLFLTEVFALGAELGATRFLVPSILMGLGIAIDVAIATTAKYQDQALSWRTWTLPVTITHTLFPAMGFLLFWLMAEMMPQAQLLLGGIGFILVALFVYESFCDLIGRTPIFGISESISRWFGFSEADSRLYVTILAVSWDALWSGPARAGQALVEGWNMWEVIFSFIVAGLVVAVVAETVLIFSQLLRRIQFQGRQGAIAGKVFGTYVELSVIGGFGVLSLIHGLVGSGDIYTSILISSSVILILFLVYARHI